MPNISYPVNLPVSQYVEDIKSSLEKSNVLIIAGETGSGKTTQLPKICLDMGLCQKGRIGHTQPRRIAARNAAARIAEELDTTLGELVGYQVRFTDTISQRTRIKVMTDGILLREIERDRNLQQYDVLIIDEAHERSLNIDFLLGYLNRLLNKRKNLKVIVTSATIDVERFSQFFNNAPVIKVEGRTYPVDIRYRSMCGEDDVDTAVLDELEQITQDGLKNLHKDNDVLVFLPGESQIMSLARKIRQANLPRIEVLPLYARLPLAEQNKIFASHNGLRVVLATNVAETSLTVPGIRYVIDTGTARVSRYSYRSKVQRLPVEAISQASANQRAGRCGRVQEGVCIRLYDEQDFLTRPEFTEPEILRTNLASVILRMQSMNLGPVEQFPFLDMPDHRFIKDGFTLLRQLGALRNNKLTALGKKLARFPVDPKLSRMLMAAERQGCIKELLVICSFLSVQDPRERPKDKQQAAGEAHRHWQDNRSDFMTILNLWNSYEIQRQDLSANQLRKYCRKNFLSWVRMKEWREVHHQLRLACKHQGFKENQQAADYPAIHQAIISALLDQIGVLDEKGVYKGARNARFKVFPGSAQCKKAHKWLVAAQLMETSQLFAHCVAAIEPEWVLPFCQHLAKYSWHSPFWDERKGRVTASEKVTLYGLQISQDKRIHYGKVEPELAREIMIREMLVNRKYRGKGGFMQHNQQLIDEVLQLEDQYRRRDLLVDEAGLFAFFETRVPVDICTLQGFEQWRKKAEQESPEILHLSKQDVLLKGEEVFPEEAQFPDCLEHNGIRWPLVYRFEPGQPDDGVSLLVHAEAVGQLPLDALEWLVPGLLKDKCAELLKSLPKSLRKLLVPIPAVVEKIYPEICSQQGSLTAVLTKAVHKTVGIDIPPDVWDETRLEDFYRMNLKILDQHDEVIEQGRDIDRLYKKYIGHVAQTLNETALDQYERENLNRWDFGDFPEEVSVTRKGRDLVTYPGLLDCGDSVSLKLFPTANEASLFHLRGLARLYALRLPQQKRLIEKEFFGNTRMLLSLSSIFPEKTLLKEAVLASFYFCFVEGRPLPVNEGEFEAGRKQYAQDLLSYAEKLDSLLVECAENWHAIRQKLDAGNWQLMQANRNDIEAQLADLMYPGFLLNTPWRYMQQLPRYLKGVLLRIEKLKGRVDRDSRLTEDFLTLWDSYQLWAEHNPNSRNSTQLIDFRWDFEELRVALFAEKLKTPKPVSLKRVRQKFETLKQQY